MQYLRHDPRNYPKPTDKALASARNLKAMQKSTPERYEEYRGEPAPAWMRASAEEIARHIDMVHYFATIHQVQLKWEQIEYGLSDDTIEASAIAKKSYKYTIGDQMPREATAVDARLFGEGSLHILNYHGTFYITYNNMVTGLYMDCDGVPRATCNNLTRESIVSVRYASEDEAKNVFDSVESRI